MAPELCGSGELGGKICVHSAPSHSQVSPSCVPLYPPKRTVRPIAPSKVIECQARGAGLGVLGVTLRQAAPSHSQVSPRNPPSPPPPKRTVRLRAESYTRFASWRGDGLGPAGVTFAHAIACTSNSQVVPSRTYGATPPPNITSRPGHGDRARYMLYRGPGFTGGKSCVQSQPSKAQVSL